MVKLKNTKFKSMRRFFKTELLLVFLFVFAGVFLRLVPHPANFAPIGALALFSGVYLSARLALFVPILAMLISDFFLGFYEWQVGLAVYTCFLFSILLGLIIKKHKKWYTITGGALVGSLVFFLVTNFAVFIFTPWYHKSLAGFLRCYFLALPFFKNTLLGDLFYAGLFFGIYELVNLYIKNRAVNIYKLKRCKM